MFPSRSCQKAGTGLLEKAVSQSRNAAAFLGPENGSKISAVAYKMKSRCLQKASCFPCRGTQPWLAAGPWTQPSPFSAQLWLQAAARPAPHLGGGRLRHLFWAAKAVVFLKLRFISIVDVFTSGLSYMAAPTGTSFFKLMSRFSSTRSRLTPSLPCQHVLSSSARSRLTPPGAASKSQHHRPVLDSLRAAPASRCYPHRPLLDRPVLAEHVPASSPRSRPAPCWRSRLTLRWPCQHSWRHRPVLDPLRAGPASTS